MRDLDDIINGSLDALAPLLTEAFESGRNAGRREAEDDLRAKLAGLFTAPQVLIPPTEPAATRSPAQPFEIEHDIPLPPRRASPGSVRPVITKLIEATVFGLTVDEITAQTGIKPNSVRGTLWTLGNEGMAEKVNGKWFAKKTEAADVEPNEAPPAASHVTPVEPEQGEGAARRPVEPVPGGGT